MAIKLDRRTKEWMQKDKPVDGRTKEWMKKEKPMDGRTNKWMDEQTNRNPNGDYGI